jgi:hypothetical protein
MREEVRRREVEQAEQVDRGQRVGRDRSLIHSANGWWRISTHHQHLVERVEDRDLEQDRQAARPG